MKDDDVAQKVTDHAQYIGFVPAWVPLVLLGVHGHDTAFATPPHELWAEIQPLVRV